VCEKLHVELSTRRPSESSEGLAGKRLAVTTRPELNTEGRIEKRAMFNTVILLLLLLFLLPNDKDK
jgi:hypothetical protein